MKNYKCQFVGGSSWAGSANAVGINSTYEVDSPEEASAAFLNEYGPLGPQIYVTWGFFGEKTFECKKYEGMKSELKSKKADPEAAVDGERSDWEKAVLESQRSEWEKIESEREKVKAASEAERREWENTVSSGLALMTGKSYLESEPRAREGLASLVLVIAAEFEKRRLLEIEISFVKAWSAFKDRGLGESLLTSLEASKPKEERGKSPGINAALMMSALQYQKLDSISHDLDEIAADVDTVSDLVEED
jgi:hypothetical protein